MQPHLTSTLYGLLPVLSQKEGDSDGNKENGTAKSNAILDKQNGKLVNPQSFNVKEACLYCLEELSDNLAEECCEAYVEDILEAISKSHTKFGAC